MLIVYQQASSNDEQIPFIAIVDANAQVVEDQRAKEYLGLDEDPAPGFAAFDRDGQVFIMGGAAFEVLPDGGFAEIRIQVPPGAEFMNRVACNSRRAFDPVHLYEIWYGCDQENSSPSQGSSAVALLSADQSNIPTSVRPGSKRHEPEFRRYVHRFLQHGF